MCSYHCCQGELNSDNQNNQKVAIYNYQHKFKHYVETVFGWEMGNTGFLALSDISVNNMCVHDVDWIKHVLILELAFHIYFSWRTFLVCSQAWETW